MAKRKVTLLCYGLTEKEHQELENIFSETIGDYLKAKGIDIDSENIKDESVMQK